jgi:type II secretory pathway component PulJ
MVSTVSLQRPTRRRAIAGFALGELIISTAIFSAVSAGLVLGFVSLKRNYAATADFAINHADQMRISDYLALDLRRAVKLEAAKNDASVYIPCYYDATEARSPQTPVLDGKGGVYYGTATCSVKVRYYLLGSSIYRKHGNDAPVELASDVQDFEFDATDLGKVVKTSIKFRPTFKASGASDQVKIATAFHNTTLLRNNRTDIQSGVY